MEFINLFLLLVDIFLNFDSSFFILWSFIQYSLLLLIVFLKLVILGAKILIDIHKVINLLIENINIGKKIVILLFSLDECVLDLLNISETCCLFDSIESFIDNFHISLIVINKFNFFLIIYNKLSQTIFKYCRSIILDNINLSSFDSATSIEFRILKFLVELS